MNTFLIKVGKSWQVIKRDGLVNGLRRVLSAFFALFRSVGSGDMLFVSGGVGDSARYRTTHVAEELEFNGFECSVAVQDNPRLVSYVNKFSVFIFHRTLYTKRVAMMIEEIKRQKKTIIFETDDLVYDPKYLKHMDYYQKMNSLERKLYDNGVGGEILRDDYVKVATTTTKFLADKLQKEVKQVFIVPNKLSVEDVKNAQIATKSLKNNVTARTTDREDVAVSMSHSDTVDKSQNGKLKVRLGYFSGTISHNKDFATITKALVRIMTKYDNVELLLVGPLDVENELVQKFGDRIKQLPYVERKKHFANIAKCDINLAPLEYDNPFCEAKSELKIFEAGIVNVPTVAVANQTYKDAIEDGVTGFVASSTDEWVDRLSKLIENEKLRDTIGQNAYEKTLKDYTTKNAKNEEYYKYLKQVIHSKKQRHCENDR
jgi:glycosyltransferase involved in cell wall biosynthesis